MGQAEIKYSFKIECFADHFFKTFRHAGISRNKNAHVVLLEVNLIRFVRVFLWVFTQNYHRKKKGAVFAHLRPSATS